MDCAAGGGRLGGGKGLGTQGSIGSVWDIVRSGKEGLIDLPVYVRDLVRPAAKRYSFFRAHIYVYHTTTCPDTSLAIVWKNIYIKISFYVR